MTARVPLHIIASTPRLEAALRYAAGPEDGPLSARLSQRCAELAALLHSPIASVYALEAGNELVLRGNTGFAPEALGQVRLKVGQGITGMAVESLRPVTVDDAEASDSFAYFPLLREERFPAFLAVPLVERGKPRGALVLQRERGPFSEEDLLLAVVAAAGLLPELEDVGEPRAAAALLYGEGNGLGRALGQAHLLSRALPRRASPVLRPEARPGAVQALREAFEAERSELLALVDRARSGHAGAALDALSNLLLDSRMEDRAAEHIEAGLGPSIALERVAAEVAHSLAGQGAVARRAIDIESFLGAVASRLSGLEPDRVRKGEMAVGIHLPSPVAIRAWASGATGALCAAPASESSGVSLCTELGLPALSGVRTLFEAVHAGSRLAVDARSAILVVNPSSGQVAEWREAEKK
jgi:phosphotransferase system enzyme I (PtsP)